MDSLRNYSSSENEEDSSPPRKRDSDDRERKSTSSRDKDKKDRRPSSSSRYEKEDHRHRSRSTEKDTKYSSSGKDKEHKSKKDHYKDDRKEYRTDRRDRDRDRDRKEKHRRERREEKKEHSSKHRSEGKEHRRRDDRKKSRSRSRDRSRRDYRGDRKKSHRRRSYSKSKSPENRNSCSPLPPTNPRPSKAQDTDSPPKQQPQKPPQVKAFDFSALVETKPVVCTKPDLPSYYNPSVINANKYTEQIQKRKLLWGKKAAEQSSSQWNSAKFSQDTDGKVQSKFLRLMGVKNVDATKPEATNSTAAKDDQIKSREDMFSNMQQQYDVARQTTHTMRGYGLGFSSQSRQL